MKAYFKSKFFYIITFLTLAAVIIPTVLCSMGHTGLLRGAVNSIFSPLRSLTRGAVESLDGYVAYFTEFDRLKEENGRLREENAALLEELHQARELEEQYEWMSEYLELKMQHMDYVLTPASVCGRSNGNYSTVLMLDVGRSSGIEKNMTVVTGDGVLGYISEVGGNWSKVSTLVESSSAVSAYSERSGDVGVVCGDYELSRDGLCKMSYLGEDSDIQPGDRILTGGFGSVYPRGLIIGYVESVEKDEFSRSLVAYVRPAATANERTERIAQVMVITDYETDTE